MRARSPTSETCHGRCHGDSEARSGVAESRATVRRHGVTRPGNLPLWQCETDESNLVDDTEVMTRHGKR